MKNLTTEELVKTYYQAMMEASEAGNHKEVLSLYAEVGNRSQEALIAAHGIRDENGERPFAQAIVEAGLSLTAWKGKLLTSSEVHSVVDGVDFITTTHIWENHTETTTKPFSESEYMGWYNDGLITQSELYAKFESIKNTGKN